ncbi:hypothetical protein ACFLZH_02505 [Patescibacteria group bacterium]
MHIKPITITKKQLARTTITALTIIASLIFGYFSGFLHHLYLTREPIEIVGEINPGGCK